MTKVIGFKVLKGVSKKTGKDFDGVVFYCVDETPHDSSTIGQAVLEQYINGEMARKAVSKYGGDYSKALNKPVKLSYGRSGYVDDVVVD